MVVMEKQRTHVSIPEAILKEIDALVGQRRRSEFLVEAAVKELVRHRQMSALALAAGSWKAKDYPALSTDRGVKDCVRKMRREGDSRLKKQG